MTVLYESGPLHSFRCRKHRGFAIGVGTESDPACRRPWYRVRDAVQVLLLLAMETIPLDGQIIRRAKELEAVGYDAFDAVRVGVRTRFRDFADQSRNPLP